MKDVRRSFDLGPTPLRLHATFHRLSEVESGQTWYRRVAQRTVLVRYALDRIEPVSYIVWITQLEKVGNRGPGVRLCRGCESVLLVALAHDSPTASQDHFRLAPGVYIRLSDLTGRAMRRHA
jgi:hypothetical protein